MHRRTACIDSPVQLSGADSASADSPGSLSQAGSGLLPASHTVQGTPDQSGLPRMKVPAGPSTPAELGPQTQRMQHPAVQSTTPATYRPRSIAQKAGMNVWSRHGSRYGWVSVHYTCPFLSAAASSTKRSMARHDIDVSTVGACMPKL